MTRTAVAPWIATLILAATLAVVTQAADRASLSSSQRARLYHKWAEESLGLPDVEARQRGLRNIMAAIALEPNDASHWLVLGRLKALGEFEHEARDCFRRAMTLDPSELAAYLQLADSYKRHWIRTLDTGAALHAVAVLDSATKLRPRATDPWLRLVPLFYEGGEPALAARCAEHALAGRPRRPEAEVAAAYVAFRRGEIERADSLFRHGIPRLDPGFEALFRNPATLLGEGLPTIDWAALDPDPTTPENEVQLEYWSRVAHAFFLYYDPNRPGLDDRARTYIRYGPPQMADQNPNGVQLYFRTFASYLLPPPTRESQQGGNRGRPPVDFPTPIQMWQYPELGMRVVLQDRSLHGTYQLQAGMDFDEAAHPDPAMLGRDLVALDGGLVFHRLPPREQRIEVRGLVARFAGARGPRLLTQVETPGGPADSLNARWLVTDAAGRRTAHGEQRLEVAACDPAERRSGQFNIELPPGAYQVTFSVRGSDGRRGLFQAPIAIDAGRPGLELSDLVLTCQDAALQVGSTSARVEADLDAEVSGSRPLSAYLEIYGLTPDSTGVTRFEYSCKVRRAATEGRTDRRRNRDAGAALISIHRDETYVAGTRRQFMVVPVQSLPAGRYRLEVEVRDQVAGTLASRAAEFSRR